MAVVRRSLDLCCDKSLSMFPYRAGSAEKQMYHVSELGRSIEEKTNESAGCLASCQFSCTLGFQRGLRFYKQHVKCSTVDDQSRERKAIQLVSERATTNYVSTILRQLLPVGWVQKTISNQIRCQVFKYIRLWHALSSLAVVPAHKSRACPYSSNGHTPSLDYRPAAIQRSSLTADTRTSKLDDFE